MRALLPGLVLLATLSAAQAEENKPVRVIPITRESAEASAALIKSPQIGRPPIGRLVTQAETPQPAAQQKNWKDARADTAGSMERPTPKERALKRVEVWKPASSGGYTVEAYAVPASAGDSTP